MKEPVSVTVSFNKVDLEKEFTFTNVLPRKHTLKSLIQLLHVAMIVHVIFYSWEIRCKTRVLMIFGNNKGPAEGPTLPESVSIISSYLLLRIEPYTFL